MLIYFINEFLYNFIISNQQNFLLIYMNSISSRNYNQAIPNQIETQEQQQQLEFNSSSKNSEGNNHQKIQYIAILAFVLLVGGLLAFKVFTSYDQDAKNGKFYREKLMTLQMIDQWKLTEQQMIAQQANTTKNIIEKSQHQISRKKMGKQSWSLLHMITGAFPQKFDDNLRQKFNIFLILFGQMYPCKLCANHFMELLKKEGLFKGNTKQQLMKYLCYLHNKVNQRLGHPIHDCSNVVEQWNTCGCSGEPNS